MGLEIIAFLLEEMYSSSFIFGVEKNDSLGGTP